MIDGELMGQVAFDDTHGHPFQNTNAQLVDCQCCLRPGTPRPTAHHLGRQSQKLTHDIRLYTAVEQSRATFVLRNGIHRAHVDVCFNTGIVAHSWRLIDAIENGEVDIDASPYCDQHGILS